MTSCQPTVATDEPAVSIIIPTYNERDNITATANAVFGNFKESVEIVVVDDNSSDGTADAVRQLDDSRIRLVERPKGRGLASAVLRGIMESRGGVVCWIDADMAYETKHLPEMVRLTSANDVVIASRFVDGGGDERHPVRVVASRLVNGFANLVLGYGIKDYDSCVVAVRREVFDSVLPISYGFGDFFIEFVYDCCRRGLRVTETPYTLTTRLDGESKSCPDLPSFLWLGFKYCARIVAIRLRPD